MFSICPWCGDVQMVDGGAFRAPSEPELAWVRATNDYAMAMMVIEDFDKPFVD